MNKVGFKGETPLIDWDEIGMAQQWLPGKFPERRSVCEAYSAEVGHASETDNTSAGKIVLNLLMPLYARLNLRYR
jgi:hypothetical protein